MCRWVTSLGRLSQMGTWDQFPDPDINDFRHSQQAPSPPPSSRSEARRPLAHHCQSACSRLAVAPMWRRRRLGVRPRVPPPVSPRLRVAPSTIMPLSATRRRLPFRRRLAGHLSSTMLLPPRPLSPGLAPVRVLFPIGSTRGSPWLPLGPRFGSTKARGLLLEPGAPECGVKVYKLARS